MAREETTTVRVGDLAMPAALMLPDRPTSDSDMQWPGVVVVHEMLGLTDDIRHLARRFADSGYVALAPDLFHGLGPKPICITRTIRAYNRGGGRSLEALDAARASLAGHPEVDGSRIGVAGFCMGGGFALLLGKRSDVRVAATFYGDVPSDLDGVCPVVAGYGGRDSLYGGMGQRLARRLDELAVHHDIVTYPDAGHSFMSKYHGLIGLVAPLPPLRAGYEEVAAEDSWNRMLAFFAEQLSMDD